VKRKNEERSKQFIENLRETSSQKSEKFCRHVYLHIKPVRAPIFCEIGLAASHDLNSRKPLSCILPASIESAAGVVSLIILTIVELDDVWHDD
jgi:hypothetical protein